MWTDLRLTAFRCLFCCFGLDAACSERPPTGWQSAVDCFLIGRYKLGRFLLCNDHETIVLRGAQPCPFLAARTGCLWEFS